MSTNPTNPRVTILAPIRQAEASIFTDDHRLLGREHVGVFDGQDHQVMCLRIGQCPPSQENLIKFQRISDLLSGYMLDLEGAKCKFCRDGH